MCGLGNGQGRGQRFVKRQTEGIGLRSSTSGKDCGRSHQRSRHHCSVVQKGRGPHCSPFPHMSAPTSMGTSRGTCLEQASLPLKAKPSLPGLQNCLCTTPCQSLLCLYLLLPGWVPVLWGSLESRHW